MTLSEAQSLQCGQIIYHREYTNADGTPQRYKVNGQVKLWKRSPWKVRVPLKHGLYHYCYMDETHLDQFEVDEALCTVSQKN